MARHLVTGAAGFIGSHLVESQRAAGHDVVAVDAFTDYYDVALKEENATGLDVRRVDLARDPLDELLDGVDAIFHLAGQPGVRASWEDFGLYVERNLLATQRLFEAAAPRGIRVVFASSSSVYGDAERYPTAEDDAPRPIAPYGVTKLACEQLASAYAAQRGLDHVALRYFTVFGPRQRPDMFFTRLLGALAGGEKVEIYGDGLQSRSFTYVSDVVRATELALEKGRAGTVYNVGGGVEATVREAISVAERVSGQTLDVSYGERAVGDVRRTAPDTTRVAHDLGWAPEIDLETGLRAQWAWASVRVASR
jgi:nucleoside-diphosphate-sugar epimerase